MSDVWPSSTIGDDERGVLQNGEPLVIDKSVEIGDLVEACDDLGIDWSQLRFDTAASALGLAIEVRVVEWTKK